MAGNLYNRILRAEVGSCKCGKKGTNDNKLHDYGCLYRLFGDIRERLNATIPSMSVDKNEKLTIELKINDIRHNCLHPLNISDHKNHGQAVEDMLNLYTKLDNV